MSLTARQWCRLCCGIVLFLTIIVGVPFAWYYNASRQQRQAVAAIERAGGDTWYYLETEYRDYGYHRTIDTPSGVPKWFHDRVGVDFYDRPAVVFLMNADMMPTVDWERLDSLQCLVLKESPLGDAGLLQLASLTNLRQLYLDGTGVTDKGARILANFRKLHWLSLRRTRITDLTLKTVSTIDYLEALDLGGTNVTDRGLEYLSELMALTVLDLRTTSVNGTGLHNLRKLQLAWIDLGGCPVTREGINELTCFETLEFAILPRSCMTQEDIACIEESLPNCQLVFR